MPPHQFLLHDGRPGRRGWMNPSSEPRFSCPAVDLIATAAGARRQPATTDDPLLDVRMAIVETSNRQSLPRTASDVVVTKQPTSSLLRRRHRSQARLPVRRRVRRCARPVTCVRAAPDGSFALAACTDAFVRIGRQGRCFGAVRGHVHGTSWVRHDVPSASLFMSSEDGARYWLCLLCLLMETVLIMLTALCREEPCPVAGCPSLSSSHFLVHTLIDT
jgi:hypothetical protein